MSISVRLSPQVREEVAAYATRTRRSFSAALKDLVELSLRMQRFPGIVFVDGPAGRRAHLSGTGLDVWEAVQIIGAYQTVDDAVRVFSNLTVPAVQIAQAYARTYPDEIGAFIKANESTAREIEQGRHPWVRAVDA